MNRVSPSRQECLDCGVWKGSREDAHFYTKEYYMDNEFNIFRQGIPLRTSAYNHYLFKMFKPLGIVFGEKKLRVLEVGCGVGFVSYSLFLDGHDVVVVDGSDWATKWMMEAYGEHDRFKIFNANFENMDKTLLGERFDFVFANHVWEHLDDPMKEIEWVFGSLNSGGKFFLLVPSKERELSFLHTHNWAFDEKCLKKWFEQAGFINVVAETFVDGVNDINENNVKVNDEGSFVRIVGVKN
jgi:2-polyprenyl-3-methyl-5-hydroxy-6-metoxy-1,4-benzoquinol methylase